MTDSIFLQFSTAMCGISYINLNLVLINSKNKHYSVIRVVKVEVKGNIE